jgi:hypothetical protein
VSVHESLVAGTAELHDNVINSHGEFRMPNQGKPEGVTLLVVMFAFTEGNNGVGIESVENSSEGIDR